MQLKHTPVLKIEEKHISSSSTERDDESVETDAEIVAVLHDVIEDTSWTFGQSAMEEGFSEEIIEALKSITKLQMKKTTTNLF